MPDEYCNAVLISPPETVNYTILKTGAVIEYSIYRDDTTEKDLVVCDICSKFLVIGSARSTKRIERHRGSKQGCISKAKRREKYDHSDDMPPPAVPTQPSIPFTPRHNVPLTLPSTYTPAPSLMSLISQSSITPHHQARPLAQTPFRTPIARMLEEPTYFNENILNSPRPLMLQSQISALCPGQWIKWLPGSVWDTYAYQLHSANDMEWLITGVADNNFIRLRATLCSQHLTTTTVARGTCNACHGLLASAALRRMMSRASTEAKPHTPWKYLNYNQLRKLLAQLATQVTKLQATDRRRVRSLVRAKARTNNYKRIVMMISEQKIAGVSRILGACLRNGASPIAILEKLQKAIDGLYRPRGGWTDREISIAFLTKALGGSRLLYAFQKAEGYPGNTALKTKKKIPELLVSVGKPGEYEMGANITTFLGEETGRGAPNDRRIGQVLMIDGVALEEACRYEHRRGIILGICREHSEFGPSLKIKDIGDIEKLQDALFTIRSCHHTKDGTVVALAPITGEDNYFPTPLILSGSCKSEKGLELAAWILRFLEVYRNHPEGEKRHGPIVAVASDGEASFRLMRFSIGLSERIDRALPLGQALCKIPGLNCYAGSRGLLTTCDPKHVVKRCATMVRSSTGMIVGHTTITPDDFHQVLTFLNHISLAKAHALLNPVDKMNVPNAVNLLQSLLEESDSDIHREWEGTPALLHRVQRIHFTAKIISYFLRPFTDVTLSLSQQIRLLSTYAHLVTALYRKHHTSFMSSALFADSQAIIKNILITVIRLQQTDGKIKYFILFEGTDRLEGVFSHVRTQDHARNFDILQLAHKLAVGAEIQAIFERYPDLYQGHVRRNLTGAYGVDHINPKSWVGDVEVGKVDLLAEYLAGRKDADEIMGKYLSADEFEDIRVDWDQHFSNPQFDHLRPDGEYIGANVSDDAEAEAGWDDDSGELIGSLLHASFDSSVADGRDEIGEGRVTDDRTRSGDDEPRQPEESPDKDIELEEPASELLNPSEKPFLESPHLILRNGKRCHIDTIVGDCLVSNRARKSTERLFRVRDVTLAEAIRPEKNLNQADPDPLEDPADMVKCGDLCGMLVQTPTAICLAVGEMINFRRGTVNRNVNSILYDELEETNSNTAITAAVQILQLGAATSSSSNAPAWKWTRDYVRILDNRSGLHTQKLFVIRIPGTSLIPLAPSIEYGIGDKPVWCLEKEDLEAVFNEAWSTLKPESDSIIAAIEALPKVTNKSANLPYLFQDSSKAFTVIDPPVKPDAQKIQGKDMVPCRLCQKQEKLSKMRVHVGKHILQALRCQDQFSDSVPEHVGATPCGWCGLDGCKTQMIFKKRAKHPTILSNCQYHYANMVYPKAKLYSESSPCTNVPIECPLCLNKDSDPYQPPSFWKYNLVQHMTMHHLNEDQTLPVLSVELMVSAHVSKKEELAMGVAEEDTVSYRQLHDLPNSDFDIPPDAQSVTGGSIQGSDGGHLMSPRLFSGFQPSDDVFASSSGNARRRAFSVLSASSSTSSRGPPPSKIRHL